MPRISTANTRTRKRRATHGGPREGSGRKHGKFKTPLNCTIHRGVAEAAAANAPLHSHSLSSYVEAALVEKLRKHGVPIDDILKSTPPIVVV